MELSSIVPWGRSYAEYCRMFNLGEADLNKSILGCGDGPAAFNAVLSARGGRVTSVDPVYLFSTGQLRTRITQVYDEVLAQLRRHQDDYIWTQIADPAALGEQRMAAMETFLADYDGGRRSGRYCVGSLPELPFENGQFELALCSHFLFLYSEQVSLTEHQAALQELLRLAGEVRIYPLLSLDGETSPHLQPVLDQLSDSGVAWQLEPVNYEFQRGATHMLRAWSAPGIKP